MSYTLHLPLAFRQTIADGLGQPAAQYTDPADHLAGLLTQLRPNLTRDERLDRAAQAQANFLAYRQLVLNDPLPSMHTGAEGSMANDRARREGYRLPDWYPPLANYIESIVVTHLGPQHAWDILLGSSGHVEHITGAGWFFSEQTVYGVANDHAWYVVLIAPPEGA